MKNRFFILSMISVLSILLVSCNCEEEQIIQEPTNDGLLMATLFVQQSAEYRALCYQAYNMAKFRLDEKLKLYQGDKKLAVVVDIDETVLDNSPFSAKSIIENTNYPMYWDEWCKMAKAKSVPGALAFLKYAESKGVETFYISNRKVHLTPATLKNLQNNGFPFADSLHLFLRTAESDKKARRNMVKETHDILLFFGDALGDFDSGFDSHITKSRNALVVDLLNDFGDDYIVLPGPTYGTWMNSLTNGVPKGLDMDSVYKSRLISF